MSEAGRSTAPTQWNLAAASVEVTGAVNGGALHVAQSAAQSVARNVARNVAQWALMLGAWLWLGEQGMRLGWSAAGGVLAVALWWAARILVRGSDWAWASGRASMGWLGLLSAVGVWAPSLFAALVPLQAQGPATTHAAHMGLLLSALLWGLWCGLVETRAHTSTFQIARTPKGAPALGTLPWPAVAAAALVLLAWRPVGLPTHSPWGVFVLLALCALVLWMSETPATPERDRKPCERATLAPHTLLVPSAMGLMMGSLWWGNGCAALGWSVEQTAAVHLMGMAALPALLAMVLARQSADTGAAVDAAGNAGSVGGTQMAAIGRVRWSLGLLALGALMLLGEHWLFAVLAMLLPSLAWAVHCCRHDLPSGQGMSKSTHRVTRRMAPGLAILLGPMLLLWVGMTQALHGPAALQWALALLGGLAFLQWASLGSINRETKPYEQH